MKRSYRLLLFILLIFVSLSAFAQEKKPLDHGAYDIWNKINESSISVDGEWVLWSLGPEDKDGALKIKSVTGDTSYFFPRGASAKFDYDSGFAAFLIQAPKDSVKKAKGDKKKKEEMPKDSLGIVNLNTGEISKIARVKSFKTAQKSGGWLAYHLEKSDVKDTTKTKEEKTESKKEKKDNKKKKVEGTNLILRNLATASDSTYSDVTDYQFSENGKWLVYTASSKDSAADGIYAVEVESGEITIVLSGPGNYKQIAIDEAGSQVAFISNRDSIEAKQPTYKLYHWRIGSKAAKMVAAEKTAGIPGGWWVSEHGKVSFSKNGKRLLFGTAPRPTPEPDEEEPDDEKVKVDIWHWKDPYLQPMQLKEAEKERKRSYLAVVHLDKKRVVQLANEKIPEVEIGGEGNADIAIGTSNMPYRQLISWDWPAYTDIYLINAKTGQRRLVRQKLQSRARLSPAAKYLTWWERQDSSWYALAVKGGSPLNLSKQIPQPVYNELHDWAYEANPYGNAGWTEKDRLFLIYDKHDIWALDPTGKKAPRNITEGLGREDNFRFRYVRLDPEERAINPDESMLLSTFHYKTKAGGFFSTRVNGANQLSPLTLMDKSFSRPTQAKNADALLFTRSSYSEFPDLWVSNLDLSEMQKVSDANPQQSDYLWGTAELMEWHSLDGKLLQGILYKPENFDPEKKYPMLVYFYEKSSQNLHRHMAPQAHRSIIVPAFYASRGYVVFVPDIPYRVGYPGESALNAVVPGVTDLINQGFVDEENIGVQGHSWGGYQIAFMVTRTNIFKAAEAGAPVSNMISAYGGIRWGTGRSRMFQYERTQSRIGGSLWEYPMRYMENSPIFWADKIETPLLIMHNDHDGHVPWYQGIELFVALRRLGQPVWLINYNDEPHWPTKFQNKKDWQIRMQQFFDHYLKGAPAPVWLKEGVPAVEKGKTLGTETTSSE